MKEGDVKYEHGQAYRILRFGDSNQVRVQAFNEVTGYVGFSRWILADDWHGFKDEPNPRIEHTVTELTDEDHINLSKAFKDEGWTLD